MKFPYSKLPSHNPNLKWIARPYIPIKISGPKRFWEGYGLIDSGADRCLFNSSGVSVILGQDGFFDAFRIKFEKDHGIIEITPVRK